jgi:putative transposase
MSAAPPGLRARLADRGLGSSYNLCVPQSLGHVYVHTVFATKNREPLILRPEPAQLHAYLVRVLAELGCPSLATGGIEDHVHILHALGRTHSVAWVMEKLKSNSSRWMKQHGAGDFWWQSGYAAFSVGRAELERVTRYIHGQRQHHSTQSFEQEIRVLCGGDPADTTALAEFLNHEPR